jgi:hypothetical protein
MNKIEQSQATKTTSETPTRIISAAEYDPDGSITAPAAETD